MGSTPVPPSPEAPEARVRTRRWAVLVTALAVAAMLYVRGSPRPPHVPLATSVEGPRPATAAGVLVFLHGRGGTLGRADATVRELRKAGLPADWAIVTLEGPYASGWGHAWGDTAEEQASSRARIRSRLHELLGDGPSPRAPLVVAGFSQGAGLALDVAVEEPRIGAVASLSPCLSMLRGELPKRDGLRIFLAHGAHDERCPVEESRSLARVLEAAKKPAQYREFDGAHTIPPEIVRAVAAFAVVR